MNPPVMELMKIGRMIRNRRVSTEKNEYFVCKEAFSSPMWKIIYCLSAILIISHAGFSQSHGLGFSSHEVVPEKRTSLHLTSAEQICLHNGTEISFDLKLKPNMETYFGYIMRVITGNHQNIDVVYNQRLATFNFIIGETFAGSITIDTLRLYGAWNKFSIRFDEPQQEASFYLHDKFICKGKVNLYKSPCCQIFFGTNNYEGYQTLDTPPMSIKDIRILEGGQVKHYFPLSEIRGTEAADSVGKRVAMVKNPDWVKPRHQNWIPVKAVEMSGSPSVAFDKQQEVLYIVAKDSLYRFSVKDLRFTGVRLAKGREVLPAGNQSIFDKQLYNFYIDQQKVSTYDTASRTWDVNFALGLLTEYWQANKFYSSIDTAIYIMGGYGQLQYKKKVQRYHIPTRHWETIVAQGDTFMPRYLAAVGTNAATDTAYIMGGYGSNTGDQGINPKYNYDLMAFSVRSKAFKHIYHLPEPASQFCFANSLIIDPGSRDFYTLIYPRDKFNSKLQLIKGSLETPSYQLMGDTIPYSFYDIESYADLFYCPVSKKLITVTLYHSKEDVTSVKIYTLDFPPNPVVEEQVPVEKQRFGFWMYIAGGLVVLLAAFGFRNSRKKKTTRPATERITPLVDEETPEAEPELSTIYLFGQFEVFDKSGNDITKQFTPLLKELFLLLLIYTYKDGKGISSEELYEALWSDKSAKDARNNYSVNIVKLKAILEKIGDCHIGRESGKWKFEILQDSMKIDYQRYVEWMAHKPALQKTGVNELLSIVHRGSFLKTVHYEWLDDIKADISGHVTDLLLQYIAVTDLQSEAEFIVKVTNAILHFDNLNEEALGYKCRCLIMSGRHKMAKDTYLKFAKEYKESYGQEFGRSFTEITLEA